MTGTNLTKGTSTLSTYSKSGSTVYGTATYGGYFYAQGKVPTNATKGTSTITNLAKS